MKTLNFCLFLVIISSLTVRVFCLNDRFLTVNDNYVICLYINKSFVNCENLCKAYMNAKDGFCRQPHCFCTDVE
uniref:Putative sodium channel toxin Ts39 n=1 Tax=Tityus serrulatus TaxID=6887 RepID=SCX39_TITSE|nr:RecName: Full=Putative sodium channel toxin Ts39; AltName: Full=Tityustoxin-39; Flags: Precursor [Tityus serrulatus]QPD99030.1 putative sodium channel toxin Ts39 [Tityus serrulatus]